MGAQDKTEKVLRELHVLVSKSETYEKNPEQIIVVNTLRHFPKHLQSFAPLLLK